MSWPHLLGASPSALSIQVHLLCLSLVFLVLLQLAASWLSAFSPRLLSVSRWLGRGLGLVALVAVPVSLGASVELRLLPQMEPFSTWQVGFDITPLGCAFVAFTSFLGAVILSFSERYLRSSVDSAGFLRRVGIVIGLIQVFALASNLAMHALIWVLISVTVHKLLRHDDSRVLARSAARKKFVLSRVGDAFFWSALLLLVSNYGTLEVTEVVQLYTAQETSFQLSLISGLLVSGTLFKAAVFPFHDWLPEAVDAPTPVSALMHAGVINAGAFLLLRLSPVLHTTPAVVLLGGFGLLSVVAGSLAGSVQSNIKQSLAWSTVAQMGFLFLELGLGYPGAAALHLLAHGMYKAHAFLKSGQPRPVAVAPALALKATLQALLLSAALSAGLMLTAQKLLPDISLHWEIVAIWAICITHFLERPSAKSVARFLVFGVGLAALAWGIEAALDPLFASGHPQSGVAHGWLAGLSVLSLGGLYAALRSDIWTRPLMTRLYVHALGGFYVGTVTTRLIDRLFPEPSVSSAKYPVPLTQELS